MRVKAEQSVSIFTRSIDMKTHVNTHTQNRQLSLSLIYFYPELCVSILYAKEHTENTYTQTLMSATVSCVTKVMCAHSVDIGNFATGSTPMGEFGGGGGQVAYSSYRPSMLLFVTLAGERKNPTPTGSSLCWLLTHHCTFHYARGLITG